MKARLVISGVKDALTNLMRTDSRFKLVYEDATAAVFVASTNRISSNQEIMSSGNFASKLHSQENNIGKRIFHLIGSGRQTNDPVSCSVAKRLWDDNIGAWFGYDYRKLAGFFRDFSMNSESF